MYFFWLHDFWKFLFHNLRRGGIFNNYVIANFPQSVGLKTFQNRSIFGEDIDIS